MNSGLGGTLTENRGGRRGLCQPVSSAICCLSSLGEAVWPPGHWCVRALSGGRVPCPEHPGPEGPPPSGPGRERQGMPSSATPSQRGHQKGPAFLFCYRDFTSSWIHFLPSLPPSVAKVFSLSSVALLCIPASHSGSHRLTGAPPRWTGSL